MWILNRMMSKKIVVNGCSYTEELYLEPSTRWSNKIGCHENLALGGGSNQRIFTTTIEHLNQSTPDVLIIGWTNIDRGMCYTSTGSRMIITNQHTFDENTGISNEDIKKIYYNHLHNSFINFKNTLHYMIHLQEYCRSKQIKLLYWNALMPEINDDLLITLARQAYMSRIDADTERQGINFNKDVLQNLISKLDHTIWIKSFWYGINEHCRDFYWREDGHVGEEGSSHWANLVKEYL